MKVLCHFARRGQRPHKKHPMTHQKNTAAEPKITSYFLSSEADIAASLERSGEQSDGSVFKWEQLLACISLGVIGREFLANSEVYGSLSSKVITSSCCK